MSHLINMPRCRAAWVRIIFQSNSTDVDLGEKYSEKEITALECQAIVSGRRLLIIRIEPTLVVRLT